MADSAGDSNCYEAAEGVCRGYVGRMFSAAMPCCSTCMLHACMHAYVHATCSGIPTCVFLISVCDNDYKLPKTAVTRLNVAGRQRGGYALSFLVMHRSRRAGLYLVSGGQFDIELHAFAHLYLRICTNEDL
eukprot:210949-Chlamydomonas_euryale.AAC.3